MNAETVLAAERALLADCIIRPAVARTVVDTVAPGDFSDPTLGAMFGLVVGLLSASGEEAVNQFTVIREAARRRAEENKKPPHVRRASFPSEAQILDVIAAGAFGMPQAHAHLIRESAVLRALVDLGLTVARRANLGEDAALLAAWSVQETQKIRDGWRSKAMTARYLGDVLDDGDDEYQWLIPDLLERSDRVMVTGGEGAGKTTLIRQLAVCTAGGVHPFTGKSMEGHRVLVIDAENSERQWRRQVRAVVAAATMRGTEDPRSNLFLRTVGRLSITEPADLGAIHGMLDAVDPALVVIGPIYRIHPKGITSDDDAAPVLAALDSIRDRGCALLIEAHAGHSSVDGVRDLRPRGSAALMGWPEFGFGLAKDVKDPGRVEVVRWRGDRDERDWPKALRRGGVLPWTDDRRPPRPTVVQGNPYADQAGGDL